MLRPFYGSFSCPPPLAEQRADRPALYTTPRTLSSGGATDPARRRRQAAAGPFEIHHYPEIADRLIGVPVVNSRVNLNLIPRHWVAARDNVLAQCLLPLACTLGDEVRLIGFDGKKPGDKKFWSHNPASQYAHLLDSVETCHPVFFEYRNYDHYFERHCKVIRGSIEQAEAEGKVFRNLTPSVMPALRERSAPCAAGYD
jgi:hypothetical protein